MTKQKIGLALGSGAARGWAHIGVLKALDEMDIEAEVVAGTSIGACVGAAWLTGQLDELQSWAQGMGLLGMLGVIDVTFRKGGLVAAERIFDRFRNPATDVRIEDLDKPFATVATDLTTGREIWLREGPLLDAVAASAAMPGVFPAVLNERRWLVDGALVNPVPVSLCRALGADVVIAVNLNSDMTTLPRPVPHLEPPPEDQEPEPARPGTPLAALTGQVGAWLGRRPGRRTRFMARQIAETTPPHPSPNVMEIVTGSIDIMQDRITRSRLAGEPPDALISPKLGHIGIMDFDRAAEAVDIGHRTTLAMRPAIDMALRRA
ncbi:NTE family protein [Azospirillum fermentarium]|uniref:patatin-like phospholipase family protein n=1 Tax=Azospirillum fermentarium TaxID=1233114 RepID=UPI002227F1A2|nr:patatin-like phospholipase family protein [Azospirillum fermentarium]MCW2248841.1 NTE family protein [Azospirillum fermentarium]